MMIQKSPSAHLWHLSKFQIQNYSVSARACLFFIQGVTGKCHLWGKLLFGAKPDKSGKFQRQFQHFQIIMKTQIFDSFSLLLYIFWFGQLSCRIPFELICDWIEFIFWTWFFFFFIIIVVKEFRFCFDKKFR